MKFLQSVQNPVKPHVSASRAHDIQSWTRLDVGSGTFRMCGAFWEREDTHDDVSPAQLNVLQTSLLSEARLAQEHSTTEQ